MARSKTDDYKKEIEEILKEKSPTEAMNRLSMIINQYFSKLFDLHYVFTYEEMIKKLKKDGKIRLKEFREKFLSLQFSKNVVSKEELENITYEFLEIIEKHPLKKWEQPPKKAIRKIKFFIRLRRFKKELQREWRRGKTFEEKLDKVVGKTGKTLWGDVRGYFSSTKTPRTVSFNAVIEDIKKYNKKRGLTAIFEEDQPTVEGFFYFIYLIFRKRLMETKKIKKIKSIIEGGHSILLEKMDVIQAKATYNMILPIYNSLSTENQKRMLPKIVLFYEDINNCIKFQKARMYLSHLESTLKDRDSKKAKQFYSEVSKLYEQMPPHYKNIIYEQFLNLEKEFNISIAENNGGKKNA